MCLKGPKGRSGQAILEYLMLLMLTIILILGFVYQFNTAFQKYLSSYFGAGGYLECLIENGILPGQQNSTGTSCPSPQLTVSSGKSLLGPSNFNGSGGSGAGGGGKGGGVGANASSAGGGLGGGGRNSDGGGSGGGGGGGLVPAGNIYGRGGGAGANAGSSKGGGGGGGGALVPAGASTGDTGYSTYSTNGSAFSKSKKRFTARRNLYAPLNPEEEAGRAHMKIDDKIPISQRDMKTVKEIAAEKAKRRLASTQDSELSFGNLFKWLIIALILFGLIFFIGSQIMAIARGSRRSRD